MKGAHPLPIPLFESHALVFALCNRSNHRYDGIIVRVYGGEGGIRTHGPVKDSSFRDCPIRPLSHLSDFTDLRCV